MKVCFTGAGGLVGTELSKLAGQSTSVLCGADRNSVDVTDPEVVKTWLRSENPDIVVNLAAYTNVNLAETERDAAFRVNADGAATLAAASQAVGIPIIHVSTDYVFDGTKGEPYTEADTPNPISAYGESKRAGELAVLETNSRAAIVRTSAVFGRHGVCFPATIVRLAQERPNLSIVDDQLTGPTAADGLAHCLLTMAEICARPDFDEWGVYHLQGRPHVSWYDFALEIVDRLGRQGSDQSLASIERTDTAHFPQPAERPLNGRMDCSKWLGMFGDDNLDWRDGLDRFFSAN